MDEAAPGPYDGYVTETDRGYEVGADGAVHGYYDDKAVAVTVLAELCASKPRWFVAVGQPAVRIDQ